MTAGEFTFHLSLRSRCSARSARPRVLVYVHSCGSAQARCRRISTERHFYAYKIKKKVPPHFFFARHHDKFSFIPIGGTPTFGSKLSTRKFCGACGFRFISPRKDVFQRETVEPTGSAASAAFISRLESTWCHREPQGLVVVRRPLGEDDK